MKQNNDLLQKEWQRFLRKAKNAQVTGKKYFRLPNKFKKLAKQHGFDFSDITQTSPTPSARPAINKTTPRAFKKAQKYARKHKTQQIPQPKKFRGKTKVQKYKPQSKTWTTRTSRYNELTEKEKQEWSEEMQRQKDAEEIEKVKTKRKSPIKDEDLALANILDIIDSIRAKHPSSADWFEEILQQEIDAYGLTSVAESISKIDREKLEELVFVAFYDEGEWHSKAMSQLLIILRGGEIPTAEEARKLYDQLEADENGETYNLDKFGLNAPM